MWERSTWFRGKGCDDERTRNENHWLRFKLEPLRSHSAMSSMEEVPASDSGMAGAECDFFIYRLRFASLFKMRIKRHTGRARRKMRAQDGRSGTMGRHSVL